MRSRLTFLFAAALLFASCKSQPRAVPQSETTETGEEAPTSFIKVGPLAEQMREHWGLATWLRDVIIAGQLDEVPQAAGLLADHQPDDAVPSWTPFIDEMKAHAKAAEKAESLVEASTATAEMARTCGRCHFDTGASLNFQDAGAPDEGPTAASHMQRHGWGTRALWNGLIGPSDEQWQLGAETFAYEPLHDKEYFDGWMITPELEAMGIRAHDLGLEAREAEEPEVRARIFGELLSTCAECHSRTAQGPP